MVRWHHGILMTVCGAVLAIPLGGMKADDPDAPLEERFEAELALVPDGSRRRLGSSMQRMIPMTSATPAGVTRGIDDPSVRYAVLPLQIDGQAVTVAVTEAADSKTGRLSIDLDGDGDLTNDRLPDVPTAKWTRRGPAAFQAEIDLTVEGESVRLSLFRYGNDFIKGNEYFEERGNPLYITREDVREGKLTLGATTYSILLKELAVRGRYDVRALEDGDPAVGLFLDRDGDGQYDRSFEQYDLAKPFTIEGITYELDHVAADGSRLVLRRSSQVVPEVPLPPTAIGRLAPPFVARRLDGTTLRFPDDFRGKIVVLDFWATWCGPCLAKKPDLVRMYDRVRDEDVEILGICLDDQASKDQALACCEKQGMRWPHVFDGQGFDGPIVKQYAIGALPAAILVDGTTGRVLAPVDEMKDIDKGVGRVLAIRNAMRQR